MPYFGDSDSEEEYVDPREKFAIVKNSSSNWASMKEVNDPFAFGKRDTSSENSDDNSK